LAKFCIPIAHEVGYRTMRSAARAVSVVLDVGAAIRLNGAPAAALADIERRDTLAPCRHSLRICSP
jgi:hypothetical protein